MRVATLAGSVVVHGALLALIAPLVHRDRVVVVPKVDEATPEPIDVEIVAAEPAEADLPPRRQGAKVAGEDGSSWRSWPLGALAVTTGRAVPEVGGPPTRQPASKPAQPTGSLYMHMRGPELHISDADADRILDHPEAPPPAVPKSGRLQSAPGGRAVIPDLVATMEVDRDGTVHVHDAPDADIHFHVPLPPLTERDLTAKRHEIGQFLSDWYADPYKETRKGPATDLPEHLLAVPGQCDEVGALNCEPGPKSAPGTITVASAGGTADLTAYLMRKLHVGDPYASRKKKLLEATLAEREERGGAFRGEQLARSAEIMRRNLQTLWATTPDPAARREALLAMWDECAEGEGPLGEAGERARAEVIGWIRTYLPRGGPGAYSDDELARLSHARGSKQAFDPYAAVVESGDVGSAGSAR